MEILKSEIHNIKDFAFYALQNKLYVDGFQLRKSLEKIIVSKDSKLKDSFIFLMKNPVNSQFIGISTFLLTQHCTIQTFVKKEYRGNHYGTLLIKEVINNVPDKLKYRMKLSSGETQSLLLFRNLLNDNIIDYDFFIDNDVKNKLESLDTYLFCKKHSLNIELYIPGINQIFNERDLKFINQLYKKPA